MALTLTPDIVTRELGDPPLGAQLADHLRQAIVTGKLLPGDKLPGEHTISEQVGVSRAVVRAAFAALETEALIVRQAGTETKVAEPMPVRVLIADAERTGQAPMLGEDFTVDLYEDGRETATAKDRDYLRLRRGATVFRRRMVISHDGEPVEIHRSAMRWGDRAADLEPDRMTKEITARMPNARERELLKMPPGPVLVVTRVFYKDGKPVIVVRTIMRAGTNLIRLDVDLPVG